MPSRFQQLANQYYQGGGQAVSTPDTADAPQPSPFQQLAQQNFGPQAAEGSATGQLRQEAGVPEFRFQALPPERQALVTQALADRQARRADPDRVAAFEAPYHEQLAGTLAEQTEGQSGLRAAATSGIRQSALSTASTLGRAGEMAGLLEDGGADELNRVIGSVAQGRRQATEDSAVPEWLLTGVEGASRSLTDAATTAAVGGLGLSAKAARNAQILSAAARVYNSSLTEAEDAGLSGFDAQRFAVTQSAIEGGVTYAFSKFGLGGFEDMFGPAKQQASRTIGQMIARGGLQLGAENVEELTIELGSELSRVAEGIKSGELALEDAPGAIRDTIVTTTLTMGAASGPRVAADATAKGAGKAGEKLIEFGERKEKQQSSELEDRILGATDPDADVSSEEQASRFTIDSDGTVKTASGDQQSFPFEQVEAEGAPGAQRNLDYTGELQFLPGADTDTEILTNSQGQPQPVKPKTAEQILSSVFPKAQIVDPSTTQYGLREAVEMASELGVAGVQVYRDGGARGFFADGQVFINASASPSRRYVREVVSHELTHAAQAADPKLTKPVFDAMPQKMRDKAVSEYMETYRRVATPQQVNSLAADPVRLQNEAEAMAVGQALSNPSAFREAFGRNRSKAHRFLEAIMRQLRKLTVKGRVAQESIDMIQNLAREFGVKVDPSSQAANAVPAETSTEGPSKASEARPTSRSGKPTKPATASPGGRFQAGIDRGQENIAKSEETLDRLQRTGFTKPEDRTTPPKRDTKSLLEAAQRTNESIDETIARVEEALDATIAFLPGSANKVPPKDQAAQMLRNTGSSLSQYASDLFVPISTRLNKMSVELGTRLRRYEFRERVQRNELRSEVREFLGETNKLKKTNRESYRKVKAALLNQDFAAARVEFAKLPNAESLLAGLAKSENVLESIHNSLKRNGVRIGKLEDYWPREVEDYDAWRKQIRGDERSLIEDAIRQKKARLGRELTDAERIDTVNKVLQGYGPRKAGQLGFGSARTRSFGEITDANLDLYADLESSLLNYIDRSVSAYERARFFGKGAETEDVEQSIGRYVDELIQRGDIKGKNQQLVKDLLEARFVTGTLGANPAIRITRNLGYATVLANPASALVQLGDLMLSAHRNGVFNTGAALADIATGKSEYSIEDLGIESIAAELDSSGLSAKLLDKSFTASGFRAIDRLGKTAFINAAEKKARQVAAKPDTAQFRRFEREYRDVFGDQKFDQLVEDLRAGRRSEDTAFLLFSEITGIQPLTLSEMPAVYLRHPNLRILYMLKTFTLRQLDYARRQIVDNAANGVRTGNREQTKQGLVDGVKYLTMMAAAGIGNDQLKAWLLGTEFDIEDSVVDSLLGLIGLSQYTLASAHSEGLYSAAIEYLAPPAALADDTTRGRWERLPNHLPVVGVFYKNYLGSGKDWKEKQQRTKAEEKAVEAYWRGDQGSIRAIVESYNAGKPDDATNLTVYKIGQKARGKAGSAKGKVEMTAAEYLLIGENEMALKVIEEYNANRPATAQEANIHSAETKMMKLQQEGRSR